MGQRLIISEAWRNKILSNIHTGHFGVAKCIRAKHSIYWPNMSNHIENLINKFAICNKFQNSNKKEPFKCHKIIRQPWQKLGIDIFQIRDEIYLLVVDYYSKYPEVINLNKNTTSKNIINT